MGNQVIIGLTAAKGSGKDLFWKCVNKHFNQNGSWNRVAFADPIKHKISNLFNIDLKGLEQLKRDNKVDIVSTSGQIYGTVSGRDFVRNIGMLMRDYDDTQFNRYVESQFIEQPESNFIVTDVRFQNEADLIHQYHGVIVKIERPGYGYDHHVTESGLIIPDYTIYNNGTISQFDEMVVRTIADICSDLYDREEDD